MSDQIDEYMRENFNCSLEAFESKLKKKLSQTQDQESVKRRDAAARHSLMLRAINLIRNNFSRACRIDLGTDCCCIELEVSDRDGWPMLELYLCDSRAPSNQDLALIVWATDRRELGTVTIGLRSGETLGTLHLHDPSEMNRLAHVVQRSIRVFLDCVAERVVKGPSIVEDSPIALDLGVPRSSSAETAISDNELFSDLPKPNKNRVDNPIQIERISLNFLD